MTRPPTAPAKARTPTKPTGTTSPATDKGNTNDVLRPRHGRLGIPADDGEHAAVLGAGHRRDRDPGPLPRPLRSRRIRSAGAAHPSRGDPRRTVRPGRDRRGGVPQTPEGPARRPAKLTNPPASAHRSPAAGPSSRRGTS